MAVFWPGSGVEGACVASCANREPFLPYPIFLTFSRKTLNHLNYSKKSHFNPVRIKNWRRHGRLVGILA